MNWKIVFADDSGSWYELFLLGYSREDAIIRAWEAVGDDAPKLISVEPLPDDELPYVNPDSVIRADGKNQLKNKYGGTRFFRIGGEDEKD